MKTPRTFIQFAMFCSISVAIWLVQNHSAGALPVSQKMKDRAALLKQFSKEFIDVRPGQEKFPTELIRGSRARPTETPVQTIKMSRAFSMSKFEVTQELFESVTGTNPSVWGGPRNSVEMVSYQDAIQFCRRATLLMRQSGLIKETQIIRLPTETEWEYCCRAGTKSAYSFGESATAATDTGKKASLLDPYGWHTGNAAGNDPPVGALKPNPWGFYDMHGYLWEYCSDEWRDRYDGVPTNNLRVLRGGSWRDMYSRLTSTTRWPIPEHVKSDAIGFRCVKAEF